MMMMMMMLLAFKRVIVRHDTGQLLGLKQPFRIVRVNESKHNKQERKVVKEFYALSSQRFNSQLHCNA